MQTQNMIRKKLVLSAVVLIVAAFVVTILIKNYQNQQAASLTSQRKLELLPSQRGEKGQMVSASKIEMKNLPKVDKSKIQDNQPPREEEDNEKDEYKEKSHGLGAVNL